MKFLRTIALLALSILAVRCEASETHWDFLSVVSYGTDCHHLVSNFSALEMAVDIYGDGFGICDHCERGGSIVGLGFEGETVTTRTIPQGQLSVKAPRNFDTPFYVIFQYDKPGDPTSYGWAELTVNTDHSVTVNRSAITDGTSIVVGATPGPIPEPTSGLLLFLGTALLALRRRK